MLSFETLTACNCAVKCGLVADMMLNTTYEDFQVSLACLSSCASLASSTSASPPEPRREAVYGSILGTNSITVQTLVPLPFMLQRQGMHQQQGDCE